MNYAFLVEPGEYLLSAFSVRVAKSVSKVGYFKAERGELVSAGTSKGGSFTVSVGEIVYIGHFALDCFQNPVLLMRPAALFLVATACTMTARAYRDINPETAAADERANNGYEGASLG